MKKKVGWGLGTLVLGALLMGVSYWQTSAQADVNLGITTTTQTLSIVFLVGTVLMVASILFFLFAASSKK
jgi:hypothetical protein